ncbi:J domain-containing protein [Erythrobacter sp. Alg231-14]|uniref:J domain-containing protein n=1 Tax=Erythrobacter sp. Alg231-14 TaxID=1922225 RepID=UPI00307BF870
MIIKITIILLALTVMFRWATGVWPWVLAAGPNSNTGKLRAARSLLGVSVKADRAEILAAHRLLITRVHPDRGGTNEKVHAANEARDLLLADLGEPPAVAGCEPSASDDKD